MTVGSTGAATKGGRDAEHWIGQVEGKEEGEQTIRIVRRAEDDDVKGQPRRRSLEQSDDNKGQMPWNHVEPEGDDTIGHPRIKFIRPLDEEGLYLVEVESDEDVTDQVVRRP